jgi:hypothetical protein
MTHSNRLDTRGETSQKRLHDWHLACAYPRRGTVRRYQGEAPAGAAATELEHVSPDPPIRSLGEREETGVPPGYT